MRLTREAPWNDHDKGELATYWRSKKTAAQIAAVMGRSERGVLRMADRLGLPKRKGRNAAVTIRLTAQEYDALKRHAETNKKTVADFTRSTLIAYLS
jgi:hypothetical protein